MYKKLNQILERTISIMTDLEIAQSTEALKIVEIAKKLGLNEDDLDLYGKYKAKIDFIKFIKIINSYFFMIKYFNYFLSI